MRARAPCSHTMQWPGVIAATVAGLVASCVLVVLCCLWRRMPTRARKYFLLECEYRFGKVTRLVLGARSSRRVDTHVGDELVTPMSRRRRPVLGPPPPMASHADARPPTGETDGQLPDASFNNSLKR
jgi:hypothetical protein